MSQNNQKKADYGKIGGAFIPIVSPFLRFAGDVFRPKEEKEAMDILRQQEAQSNILGSPTGNYNLAQTGYGNMLNDPAYQQIQAYNQAMFDARRADMVNTALALEPITDRAKQRDFDRQMGAARFRNQLGTQQGLTLQGQMGAQQMAGEGLRGATTALTSNYQYQ